MQLSKEQGQQLVEISARVGKPWQDLLADFIANYPLQRSVSKSESAFDVLSRHGIVGSMEDGPSDSSTNPKPMERFGKSRKD